MTRRRTGQLTANEESTPAVEPQTALEKIKTWLATYAQFPSEFEVDYTDRVPANGGIFPAGVTEVSRRRDILGGGRMTKQYNFAIYFVYEKAPGDGTGAAENAEWIIAFQEWVQEQSAKRLAPVFGDYPTAERITASNGTLYAADEEGTATYVVQLSVQFIKNF